MVTVTGVLPLVPFVTLASPTVRAAAPPDPPPDCDVAKNGSSVLSSYLSTDTVPPNVTKPTLPSGTAALKA